MVNLSADASNLIVPGDEDWIIDGDDLRIVTRAAIDKYNFVMGCRLHGYSHDITDPSDAYSRFYKFKQGNWVCAEVNAVISSILRYKVPGWSEDGIVVLTNGGTVRFVGDSSFSEEIDASGTPIMRMLSIVGDKLYASGLSGCLYRRDVDGWHHDDAGLMHVAPPVPRPRSGDREGSCSLARLIRTQSGDEYIFGTAYISRPILYWRPSGGVWQWAGLDDADKNFDDAKIGGIHCASHNTIWISTNKGTILEGRAGPGFKPIIENMRDDEGNYLVFGNFAIYNKELFVGGEQVCRVCSDGTLERQFGEALPVMGEEGQQSNRIAGQIEAVDGVLWAIAYGVAHRFDGVKWESFAMPSVYSDDR